MKTFTFQVLGYTAKATGPRVEIFQGEALQAIVAIHNDRGIFTVTEWARGGAGRLPTGLQRDLVAATEFALRAYWGDPARAQAA